MNLEDEVLRLAAEVQRLTIERDEACRVAASRASADKLSDCWLFLDQVARYWASALPSTIAERAAVILRKQGAPGWRDTEIHGKAGGM